MFMFRAQILYYNLRMRTRNIARARRTSARELQPRPFRLLTIVSTMPSLITERRCKFRSKIRTKGCLWPKKAVKKKK